jgi:hypothetical protein
LLLTRLPKCSLLTSANKLYPQQTHPPPCLPAPPSLPIPPRLPASPTNSYIFSVNHNASSGPAAASYLKLQSGEYGDLVVVPYFKLPPYGEKFNDTEGRFPMLEQLEQFLRNDYFGDTSILWFAQVMPEKEENGEIEYLAVDIGREGLRLIRLEPT